MAVIFLTSMIITPFAIQHAYIQRGQLAFGGEILIIPFAIILCLAVHDLGKEWDRLDYKIKTKLHTPKVKKTGGQILCQKNKNNK